MIEPGTILQDRFLVEEQIGVGGMGAVYRAVDQKFGTSVAIKETFYNDPALAEAFEREARLLNGLHHPLFPHVSDHFVEGNGHFLVMEYIEGEDLSALLKRGERFSVETVVGWTRDLLDGLDHLHSQDPPIIHRDVKPSNLRLTLRGNLVLLDFGMAKETSGDTQGMRSVFGYSRRYSPLEQIEGTGTDVRSDIFSLGATVYHLLSGSPPIDVLARASAIVAGRPDPLQLASELGPEIPNAIAAVIHSALALDPDKRFVSARSMWNSLEAAMSAESSAAAPVGVAISRPAVEEFPALEAFENDGEMNRPVVVPVVQDTVSPRVGVRSSALIAALAVFVLGLFGYGLYQRSGGWSEDESAQEVVETAPVEPTPDSAATAGQLIEDSSASSGAIEPEIAEAESAVSKSEEVPDAASERRASTTESDKKATGKKTTSVPGDRNDRSVRTRTSRTGDQRSDRQAPVSSIESVLTGMPDRVRQQRQWEIWEQEELRRQRRLRRQMRQNRLPYPY